MSDTTYEPDRPAGEADLMIIAGSGPEPAFDAVTADFLTEGYLALNQKCDSGGLLDVASLGLLHPWLFRLTFGTRGFVREADGEITQVDRHVVAVRFLPDYLRHAERFAMLRLIEPSSAFHPNIGDSGPMRGAICVEVYAGESLVEICQSLHDLFRWRLRQYDERDALNPVACAWGRENIAQPIDDRPLFGQRLSLQWKDSE